MQQVIHRSCPLCHGRRWRQCTRHGWGDKCHYSDIGLNTVAELNKIGRNALYRAYYSNICQTKHRIKKYIGYAFRSWLGMGLQRHGQLQGTLPPQGLPIPIESVHCTFTTSGDYMQSLRSLKNTCRASVHMMLILNKVLCLLRTF